MGNICPRSSGTYVRYLLRSPPFGQLLQVVANVFPRHQVLDVLLGIGGDHVRNERRLTGDRLVLALDVTPKSLFSLLNVRSAEPCAIIGSTVDDGPGLSVSVPPETRAR